MGLIAANQSFSSSRLGWCLVSGVGSENAKKSMLQNLNLGARLVGSGGEGRRK